MTIVRDLFGWPGTWGVGGNLLAGLIFSGAAVACGWLFRKVISGKAVAAWNRHGAPVAKALRDDIEKNLHAKLAEHHASLRALAQKHQQEQLDRLDVHHESLKAHVSAVVAAAIPAVPAEAPIEIRMDPSVGEQKIADALKDAVVKRGPGQQG